MLKLIKMKKKLNIETLEKRGYHLDNDGCYELNNIAIVPDFTKKRNVFLKSSESNNLWFEVDIKVRFLHELVKLEELFNN